MRVRFRLKKTFRPNDAQGRKSIRLALFSAMIAMAGLPIYIHAPKFYVDSYQISLGTLGATLFGLRLLDVVQDPFLGGIVRAIPKSAG